MNSLKINNKLLLKTKQKNNAILHIIAIKVSFLNLVSQIGYVIKIVEDHNLFSDWGANLKKCFTIVESSVSFDNKTLNDFNINHLRDYSLKNFHLTEIENEKLFEFFEFLFNSLNAALNGFNMSLKSRLIYIIFNFFS